MTYNEELKLVREVAKNMRKLQQVNAIKKCIKDLKAQTI